MKTMILTVLSLLFLSVTPVIAEQKAVSQLNELLRGEISAVETYQQALTKLGNEPRAKPLQTALNEHREAMQTLKTKIQALGGVPSTDSGAWGTLAETVVGSAKLLGDQAALKALKEGEEHGVKEYKEALENEHVPAEFKTMISNTFLPRQQKHIATIDSIMAQG